MTLLLLNANAVKIPLGDEMNKKMEARMYEMDAKYLKDNLQHLVDEYSHNARSASVRYFHHGKSERLEYIADIAVAEKEAVNRVMEEMNRLLGQITKGMRDTDNEERKKDTFVTDLSDTEQKQIVRDMLGDDDCEDEVDKDNWLLIESDTWYIRYVLLSVVLKHLGYNTNNILYGDLEVLNNCRFKSAEEIIHDCQMKKDD